MMKLRVGKTEIEISYLLICLLALSIILDKAQKLLLCLFAIVVHEAGHILMMIFFGFSPKKIKISLFEISINDAQRSLRSKKQNILIIFFGPFANFICFICFYLLYLFSNENELFLSLAATNISVCLFNILPALSLDGGQLIYLFLSFKFDNAVVEKIVNIITFIILFPLSVLGLLVLFDSKYNFSLLFICVYLVATLFMRNNKFY